MQSNPLPKIGVAVNFFFDSSRHPQFLKWVTLTCLSKLRLSRVVGTIVLCDGSATPQKDLSAELERLEIKHLHLGRPLTFAEGYNAGARILTEDFVALVANDVIVQPAGIADMVRLMAKDEKIGCVIPRLTKSDYPAQRTRVFPKRSEYFVPSLMTLNFNLFRRPAFEAIGGIDTRFSGAYNDVVAKIKLKESGYKVVCAAHVVFSHMGAMTVSAGSSFTKETRNTDCKTFKKAFSHLWSPRLSCSLALWKADFGTPLFLRALWRLVPILKPVKLGERLEKLLFYLEPTLSPYKQS